MITVDVDRVEVRVGSMLLERMPKKSFLILSELVKANGKVLSRRDLLYAVSGVGREIDIDTRTIDVHIARIRKCLGKKAAMEIVCVVGFGYKFKRLK